MKVWVAIINDRHTDTDAEVFTAPDAAVAWLKAEVASRVRHSRYAQDEELTEAMKRAGWIYYVDWSSEGDSAWIIEKETDPASRDHEERAE